MIESTAAAIPDDLDQDYQAQLILNASGDVVFDALTTIDGLTDWWTAVTGDGLAGGELTFRFGPGSYAVMRVEAAERGIGVHWITVACHFEDWVGTRIHFDIEPTPSGGTELRFRHEGLNPRLECFGDCKSGWDHFIPSLAGYAESGVGHPNQSAEDLARREVRERRRESANAD
jgi:hypothetical protein